MSRWSRRVRSGAIAASVVVLMACSATGRDASTAGSPLAIASPVQAESTGSAAPVSVASPSVDPTGSFAVPASAGSSGPPPASLAAEGGDPVAGQLGSYTWAGSGSDSPWLPGAPVSVGVAEPLTVTFGAGASVTDWTARRVPAGSVDGAGADRLGGGGGPIAFTAPGPGSWSVQVVVTFMDGLGSAAYYWTLIVP